MKLLKPSCWLKWLAVATFALLTSCATSPNGTTKPFTNANVSSNPNLIWHAFEINGWYDDPAWAKQADLLAYSYGDQYHMVRREVKYGEQSLGYSGGVNGPMPVGEFLYVKWRIKATGEEIEDKVDLRNRLPNNMFNHSITFVIDGKQLYVYLVTPQGKMTNGPPILKTTKSRYYVTYEIYPNNTYKNKSRNHYGNNHRGSFKHNRSPNCGRYKNDHGQPWWRLNAAAP